VTEPQHTDGDTPVAPDTATDATDVDTDSEAPADQRTAAHTDDDGKLRREAAKYRTGLRAAEAERDGLRARLDAMQRAEVERLAADDLAQPADLWLLGAVLPDLLDDDGNVDQAKVGAAVKAALTDRPGWRRMRAVSFDGGDRGGPTAAGPSWADTLRDR